MSPTSRGVAPRPCAAGAAASRAAGAPVTTSLQGRLGRTPSTPDDLRSMATAAWHKRGVAMIRLEDLPNEFDRLAVEAIATSLYGKRTPSE
ncbi:hypothetical protein UAJ10_22735 [Nitrospirillum sp. BR 11164]|uniref:hypothetical protein n=1 Tax=Nitrospirillum sp. BR 11164 TaxID=3104324 RepID=UPI002AFE95D7|nr:hypothetical protein [Nitrospirillum sp. BR 11164]MEA1651817.1 hypothetical protein [Nitrospirillum sp. BR 11164]